MPYSYKQLIAWQKAKALAVDIYRISAGFPSAEQYGLTSQLRRAAVSVASNIAEGQGRLTPGEFRHFLGQARGSLLELQTQLAIALDLHYLTPESYHSSEKRSEEVLRLINGLLSALRISASPAGVTRNSKPETRN
ncbi:MAG TPA: four helix bundle protein [Terriglobales bacterium]|nr:four helix bundle protein [Terriglobales bacterium]